MPVGPTPNPAPATLPLWPGRPTPNLTVSLAEKPDPHGAVLVCPGGGYGHLAVDHEGHDVLAALNEAGFDAAMLRYRLGPIHHHPAMIHDATRGMRLLRATLDNARRLKRCAVLGFSAGGHLAATLSVHPDTFPNPDDDLADTYQATPDVAVLGYPVIDLDGRNANLYSRKNLLGESPEPALVSQLSPHLHVTPQTPPTFLWHTFEDAAVSADDSLAYAKACRANDVPCELHVFERGRHGLGLAPDDETVSAWFPLALAFLRRQLTDQTSPETKAEPINAESPA